MVLAFDRASPGAVPVPFYDLLTDAAALYSDKIALAVGFQPADLLTAPGGATGTDTGTNYLRLTHGQLQRAGECLAAYLFEQGVRPGMTIVSLMYNGAEFHILFRAALALRCPFCPLTPLLASNPEVINHILDVCDAKIIVAPDPSVAGLLNDNAPESMKNMRLKFLGDDSAMLQASLSISDWTLLSEVYRQAMISRPHSLPRSKSDRKVEDVVMYLFTSGTTSLPKCCPYNNANICTFAKALEQGYDISQNSSMCIVSTYISCFQMMLKGLLI